MSRDIDTPRRLIFRTPERWSRTSQTRSAATSATREVSATGLGKVTDRVTDCRSANLTRAVIV